MNPGVLEEIAGTGRGVVEALKGSPMALAMGIMNIALLLFLFYYLSRITTRTELTVSEMFKAQDKVSSQWLTIVKDTGELAEKSLHCITVDDALKLLGAPRLPPANPLKLDSPVPWLNTMPIRQR